MTQKSDFWRFKSELEMEEGEGTLHLILVLFPLSCSQKEKKNHWYENPIFPLFVLDLGKKNNPGKIP